MENKKAAITGSPKEEISVYLTTTSLQQAVFPQHLKENNCTTAMPFQTLRQAVCYLRAYLCRNCRNCRNCVDTDAQHQHNTPTAFNRAAGFSSPHNVADKPPIPIWAAFLRLHTPKAFSYGKQGREALRLLEHVASLLTRLLFPAHTFSSVQAGLKNQREKAFIMTKIRKGYTSPIMTHPLRTFPSLIQAAAFVDRLTDRNDSAYRFNIIQQGSDWTVSRVIVGGVR